MKLTALIDAARNPVLRRPLAACLLSLLASSSALIWSINSHQQAQKQLAESRRQHAHDASQLGKLLDNAAATAEGMALYHELAQRDTAPDQPPSTFAPAALQQLTPPTPVAGQPLWQAQTWQLKLTAVHEGHFLTPLKAWQQQAPGLHQLRACRMTRVSDGLQVDCQLQQLTLHKGEVGR